MFKSYYLLFGIPALIWGSTWYVITYQLGKVDPLFSVSYRFFLAGAILFAYARIHKLSLAFSVRQHLFIALQGLLLFGINYWLVYLSEQYISSGLVAVGFSTLIFFNIFFGAILIGSTVHRNMILGAVLGLIGTVFIYQAEFYSLTMENNQFKGLLLCIGSITLASLGNITSSYNQSNLNLPVIQTNAYGMLYGAILMMIIAVLSGKSISFDNSLSYILSLVYLSIFGSVIAFTAYLTLIGKIGAGKAAYAIVLVPIIALAISYFLEGYQPDIYAIFGCILIVVGNVMAMKNLNQ